MLLHWAGRALVLGIVAVAAVGISRGGLPSKTLQVRWEYWQASARMVADHPVLGVGPGNFGETYLQYRLPGAEEEVKNPHNVILHALTEYGLTGGLVYLALLVYLLVKLAAPARPEEAADAPPRRGTLAAALAVIWAAAVLVRIASTRYPDPPSLVYDNFIVIFALGAGLALAAWQMFCLGTAGRFSRIALACGLGGFALHNLSDFGLFLPGAAMAFWVGGGSILAGVEGRSWRAGWLGRIGMAIILALAVAAAATLALVPVARKTAAVTAAADALGRPNPNLTAAIDSLGNAVGADPLDAGPAIDLANLYLHQAEFTSGQTLEESLSRAWCVAVKANERSFRRSLNTELLARVQSYELDPSLLQAQWTLPPPNPAESLAKLAPAMEREPGNHWLLNRSAQYAFQAGQTGRAIELLQKALEAAGNVWPLLYDHLGDVYYQAGRTDDAREAWRHFMDARKGNLPQWTALATAARTSLNAYDPQNPRLHLRLAEFCWQAGQPALAADELRLAEQTENALRPESVVRFTPLEKAQITLLKAKLAASSTTVR